MKTINDYADLVKEQHALNTTIAPVETDLTSASKAYAVGQKFIYDGVLYQAKTAIAQGAALVLNTNYEAADDVSSEIQTLTNQVKDMNNVLGAKNLLPNQALDDTWNGITWKVNSDGTLSASGTATANSIRTIVEAFEIPVGKYILNGCPSGSGYSTYYLNFSVESGTVTPNGGNDIGEGLAFEVTQTAKITVKARVLSGQTVNIAFKPMIRLATDSDPTYQPYAKTNRQLTEDSVDWDDLSEVGAVNPINFTAISPTSPISGVTFTVNSDKSITCSDATATGNIRFDVGTATLKAGKSYRINDLKNGTANVAEDGPFGVAVRLPGSTWIMNTASTPGAQPTIYSPTTDTEVEIIVYINSGYNANRTFYPMLTCATYTGPYVPPAKTNKELTEELEEDSVVVTENGITANFSKWGKVCTISFTGAFNAAFAYDTVFLNIPSGFAPNINCQMLSTNKPSSVSDRIALNIGSNGTINVAGVNVASGDALRGSYTYITA